MTTIEDILRVRGENEDGNAIIGAMNGLVISLVFWVPVLAYLFRKPILHFFGVNA